MITQQEIKSIDTSYFEILQVSSFAIYIRSNNTGHLWGLLLQQYPTHRSYCVYHKHSQHYEYHKHPNARSVAVAIERIMSHDIFQLNGRQPIKHEPVTK
jgi:hypothetical protein